MEGACESNNSNPKWQNLKFAEISVWKRVRDHFQAFCRLVISNLSPMWRGTLCVVHAFLWMPPNLHCKQAEAHA